MLSVPSKNNNSSNNSINNNNATTTTSMDLLEDYLIAGYSDGQLILWDCLKGNILKQLSTHTVAITSVKFIHECENATIVSVNEKGLVNKIGFSKTLWNSFNCETECLLDGSAGSVPAMSVLYNRGSGENRIGLIALTSERSR